MLRNHHKDGRSALHPPSCHSFSRIPLLRLPSSFVAVVGINVSTAPSNQLIWMDLTPQRHATHPTLTNTVHHSFLLDSLNQLPNDMMRAVGELTNTPTSRLCNSLSARISIHPSLGCGGPPDLDFTIAWHLFGILPAPILQSIKVGSCKQHNLSLPLHPTDLENR